MRGLWDVLHHSTSAESRKVVGGCREARWKWRRDRDTDGLTAGRTELTGLVRKEARDWGKGSRGSPTTFKEPS